MKITTRITNNKEFLAIASATLILLTIGLLTKVNLGDEMHHFRHAEVIYNSDERPIVDPDPIYQRSNHVRINYSEAILWHSTLAWLWKIGGGVSFSIAQIYHCFFLCVLIFSAYLLGKELFSREVGINGAFVLLSTPMVIVFSVLFYMEIPVLAFCTLSMALVAKQKHLLAGIAFGLAMMTKINAILFLPGVFLFILFFSNKTWGKRLINVLLFCSMVFLINLPDGQFRYKTWGYYYMPIKKALTVRPKSHPAVSPSTVADSITTAPVTVTTNPAARRVLYSPSSLYSTRDIASYFGIVTLSLLLVYVFARRYQKSDLLILMSLVSYAILYAYLFVYRVSPTLPDIRYLMPILPLLTVLGAKALVCLPRKLKVLVLALCLLQFIVTSGFIYVKRNIPRELEQGFAFIKKNLPEDCLLVYPEVNIRYYSKRLSIWTGVKPFIKDFLWSEDRNEISKILKDNTIDYIVIKKSRVYDNPKKDFTGGYPRNFIDRLPTYNFLNPIFNNSQMSIWQVVDNTDKTI